MCKPTPEQVQPTRLVVFPHAGASVGTAHVSHSVASRQRLNRPYARLPQRCLTPTPAVRPARRRGSVSARLPAGSARLSLPPSQLQRLFDRLQATEQTLISAACMTENTSLLLLQLCSGCSIPESRHHRCQALQNTLGSSIFPEPASLNTFHSQHGREIDLVFWFR